MYCPPFSLFKKNTYMYHYTVNKYLYSSRHCAASSRDLEIEILSVEFFNTRTHIDLSIVYWDWFLFFVVFFENLSPNHGHIHARLFILLLMYQDQYQHPTTKWAVTILSHISHHRDFRSSTTSTSTVIIKIKLIWSKNQWVRIYNVGYGTL